MEITGRITADAKLSTLKDGRQVVNFSVAVNDRYKPKGSEVAVKVATFFKCSYWMNPGIAQHLTKGTLVELTGRVSARAWTGNDGEAHAGLNFHTSNIKLHGGGKKSETVQATAQTGSNTTTVQGSEDDLPF